MVNEGRYVGNLTIPKNVRIYGGFDDNGNRNDINNKTVISGNISVNSLSVSVAGDDSTLSELNGFCLVNGTINVYGGCFATIACNTNGLKDKKSDSLINVAIYRNASYYGGNSWVGDLCAYGGGSASPGTPDHLIITSIGRQTQMVAVEKPSDSTVVNFVNLPLNTSNYQKTQDYEYMQQLYGSGMDGGNYAPTTILSILKNKNINGEILAQDMKDISSVGIPGNASKEPFGQSALLVVKYISSTDVETAMRLADIINNPTSDQKTILDVIKALLIDTDKVAKDQGSQASPELKKAQDELLNAVANILLAQGMPDLLKKGDMSNIKIMFQELDTQKNKIMLEYAKSTKPYYDSMLKDLAKNMAILQLKNILNGNMSKEELDKLPPSELDKILEKIKNMKDKTFEEEYILQQEAKYRKGYIDPNKKKLESDMKDMLNNFTKKINYTLKSAEKK